MPYSAHVFGSRVCPLTCAQIRARCTLAQQHGVEFDVLAEGRTSYSIATDDLGDTAYWERIVTAVKDADVALDDGAPAADW